jgi:hypothetical protein
MHFATLTSDFWPSGMLHTPKYLSTSDSSEEPDLPREITICGASMQVASQAFFALEIKHAVRLLFH